MLNWVYVWTLSWPVHDLNILLVQKVCCVTCCMGRGIVLDVHKVMSKHPPQDLDIPMLVHDSIHHDQLTPPPWWIAPHTMTDGPRFPSLGWTQALISLSPYLRRTRTRPSLWYRENRDSSLKIQCLHCLRSHTLCLLPHSRRRRLCSKWAWDIWLDAETIIRWPEAVSEWFELTSAPQIGGSSAFADEEPRWSGSFWPFGTVDSLPMAWRFSSNLHASSDVVG